MTAIALACGRTQYENEVTDDIVPDMAVIRGQVSRTAWNLPTELSEAEWRSAGEWLGKLDHSTSWWLGDWWAFGESRYGERKAIVESDDWEGPNFQACMDAASVCRAFQTSRRHEVLSFRHHRDVAALPTKEADALLDWCEETVGVTGKPRSTRELRSEVLRRRDSQPKVTRKPPMTKAAKVRLSVAGKNPERRERQKMNAMIWGQVRDALTNLTSLPAVADVVRITIANDRAHLVDRTLVRAITWIKDFEHAWNAQKGSSDQANQDAAQAHDGDIAGNGTDRDAEDAGNAQAGDHHSHAGNGHAPT